MRRNNMEEKKLTDEEIVKAFEHCSHNRSCEYCLHNDEVGSGEIVCRSRLMGKACDLIHRLQSENESLKCDSHRTSWRAKFLKAKKELEEYERKFEEGELVSKEWHDEQVGHAENVIAEQRDEIERLNDMKFTQEHCDLYKENEWLKTEIKRELAEHEEFTKKAKAEIETLLCKNAELEVRCEGILKDYYAASQTCDEQKDIIERLEEERDKYQEKWQTDYMNELNLQKQVDELKKTIAIKEGYIDRVESEVVELQFATKKAVKDTAREIYNEINSCIEQGQDYCGLDWRGLLTAKNIILVYCKKKGVEVE